MPSLTIVAAEAAELVGTALPLSITDLTIGRDPGNVLVLRDPLLSRHHARIRPVEQGFLLEDLGSSNGVQVNEQRITQRVLVPGDRIQIGRTVLVFEAQAAANPAVVRCAACGLELEADARFCSTCGVAVTPAGSAAPRQARRELSPPARSASARQGTAPGPASAQPLRRPSRHRGWLLWGALGLGLAAIGVGGRVLLQRFDGPPAAGRASSSTAARAPRLASELQAAAKFRIEVATGWRAALQRVATPEAIRRLDAISEAIWPDPQQTAGWVYLLETSLICPGARKGDLRPVAYYHPWSDVFLLTVWESRGDRERLRLADVELLMGDFVRKKGHPKFETGRPAAHQAVYLPLSIGLRAGETIRAFEAAFDGAASGTDWRAAIPALRDEELVQVNRVGAGLQIAANLAPLGLLALPAPEARGTRQVRAALKRLLQAVRAGQTAAALSRSQVRKETQEELARLPLERWEHFKPVSYLLGSRRGLLLLSQSDQTDRYLALVFARGAFEARLERVDLFSFNVFYRDLAALRQKVRL